MNTIDKLRSIKHGKSAKVGNKIVIRIGDDEYKIGEEYYTLNEAVPHLADAVISNDHHYDRLAFMVVMPTGGIMSYHKCRSKQEHNRLLEYAKQKSCYLYYADLKRGKDGSELIQFPMVVDWASVPDVETHESTAKEALECKRCKMKFKSRSGYTLHMKSKH